jgi:hypothetical protein
MTFEQSLREVAAARRALMAAIQAEEAVWGDATYRRIRERHLEPLLNVMERFEADLGETSEMVTKSMRRLDQGR